MRIRDQKIQPQDGRRQPNRGKVRSFVASPEGIREITEPDEDAGRDQTEHDEAQHKDSSADEPLSRQ